MRVAGRGLDGKGRLGGAASALALVVVGVDHEREHAARVAELAALALLNPPDRAGLDVDVEAGRRVHDGALRHAIDIAERELLGHRLFVRRVDADELQHAGIAGAVERRRGHRVERLDERADHRRVGREGGAASRHARGASCLPAAHAASCASLCFRRSRNALRASSSSMSVSQSSRRMPMTNVSPTGGTSFVPMKARKPSGAETVSARFRRAASTSHRAATRMR
ncbi:MAG TPA: hypothetical protein VGU70_09320 [Methylobacterium sp.]|nr:hypothetical protein [Methylobacterium sp.]